MKNIEQLTPITCVTGQRDTHLANIQNHRLHKEIIGDFLALQLAAERAGFDLTIASSFRDFNRQGAIWNRKFSGQQGVYDKHQHLVDLTTLTDIEKCTAIMLYSALPGASRHHLGTDLDVFDARAIDEDYQLQLSPHEYEGNGPFAPLSDWLNKHLSQFGFYRPYSRDLGGVAPELWHISHIKQSQHLVNQLTEKALYNCIKKSDLLGKEAILANISTLYSRFVTNVSPPS
jgi:LAS superfamily LD-carboxypeptidase LdcB